MHGLVATEKLSGELLQHLLQLLLQRQVHRAVLQQLLQQEVGLVSIQILSNGSCISEEAEGKGLGSLTKKAS